MTLTEEFENRGLARAMAEVAHEDSVSREEALRQLEAD